LGKVRVSTTLTGYQKRRLPGRELLSNHELHYPPLEMETTALWLEVPRPLERALILEDFHFLGSLHAAEHAALALTPVFALCDRGDVGGVSLAVLAAAITSIVRMPK